MKTAAAARPVGRIGHGRLILCGVLVVLAPEEFQTTSASATSEHLSSDVESLTEFVQSAGQRAEEGDPCGAYCLGKAFTFGLGVARNEEAGLAYYRWTASLGVQEAYVELGLAYVMGRGTNKDPDRGLDWIRLAAEGGHPRAQYTLARLLYDQIYVPRNCPSALDWAVRAARAGSREAMELLGEMHLRGKCVGRDPMKGVDWTRRAAERGHKGSMYRLGMLYARGSVVARDEVKALQWFILSGFEVEWLETLEATDPSLMDEAKDRASKWREEHESREEEEPECPCGPLDE